MAIGFLNDKPRPVKRKSSTIHGVVRTPDYSKIEPNFEITEKVKNYIRYSRVQENGAIIIYLQGKAETRSAEHKSCC